MEVHSMTCLEAQALITPFINDKLDVVTLEKFIQHIENCKECKEELEVYFAILTATKQLDDDDDISEDFAKEFKHKLEESQEFILKKKIIHIRKKVLFYIIVVVCGLFMNRSINITETKNNKSQQEQYDRFFIKTEVFRPYIKNRLMEQLISDEKLVQ